MDILSSGYLRSILCLIGTTIVQMFSKQNVPTLYQDNKWLHSRQPYEGFKNQNERWTTQNVRKVILSENPLMLKQFNRRWMLQITCFHLVTLVKLSVRDPWFLRRDVYYWLKKQQNLNKTLHWIHRSWSQSLTESCFLLLPILFPLPTTALNSCNNFVLNIYPKCSLLHRLQL